MIRAINVKSGRKITYWHFSVWKPRDISTNDSFVMNMGTSLSKGAAWKTFQDIASIVIEDDHEE